MNHHHKIVPLSRIVEYQKLFQSHEFRGEVLISVSILEEYLNYALTQYFVRSDRYAGGLELVFMPINLDRKIAILEHLPIIRRTNYLAAVSGLRAFQRLRNLIAHSSFVPRIRLAKLLENREVELLISDYPVSTKHCLIKTEIALLTLMQTKGFRDRGAAKQFLDSGVTSNDIDEIYKFVFGS